MSTINVTDEDVFAVSRHCVIRAVSFSLHDGDNLEMRERAINEFINDDDVCAIIAAAEIYFDADHTISFYTLVGWIAYHTHKMMFLHGDDGIDKDRPSDTNRFTYWYQHLSHDFITAEVDNIRSFKPCVEVLKTDKAISCDICQRRVRKHEVIVHALPQFPVWHSKHSYAQAHTCCEARCCSKSECINKMEFPVTCRRAPVVNSAPEDELAIDVASEVKAVKNSLPKFAPRFFMTPREFK